MDEQQRVTITSPRFALLFVTIPQAILTALLTIQFLDIGELPSVPLLVVFGIQIILVTLLTVHAIGAWNSSCMGKLPLKVGLWTFLILLSVTLPLLLQQFTALNPISPETIYGALSLIPLIYLTVVLMRQESVKLFGISSRIWICVGIPFVLATAPFVISAVYYDVLTSIADIVLMIFFALFFVWVCLIFSVVDHYRVAGFSKKKLFVRSEDKQSIEEVLADCTDEEANNGQVPFLPKPRSTTYKTVILIFVLILPIICLMINQAFECMLGDFSDPWFYLLAMANGIAMFINPQTKRGVLINFFVKCLGFMLVAYFAAVMLRFVPIAVSFFYLLGLPLLLLTPFIILTAQIFQIIDDIRFLRQYYSIGKVSSTAVLALALLVSGISMGMYVKKVTVDNALCYLEPSTEKPTVNLPLLKTTMSSIRVRSQSDFSRIDDFSFIGQEGYTPYFSEIFESLVFGDRLLTENTHGQLNKIFFPEELPDAVTQVPDESVSSSSNIKLTGIKVDSVKYDDEAKAYRAWVHIELTASQYVGGDNVYSTSFKLPDGVFVTDYYLDVNDVRKKGILSDRQTAIWTFEQLIPRQIDPGIIYLTANNQAILRVFPFNPNEIRRTGFEVMYRSDEQIIIDDEVVRFPAEVTSEPVIIDGLCYMPAEYKKNLEKAVPRTPRYCFILDISNQGYFDLDDRVEQIRSYAADNNITDAPVYLTDYRVRYANSLPEELEVGEGGFNLALAIHRILEDSVDYPDTYPVILVVSSNMTKAVTGGHSSLLRLYPEVSYFYRLGTSGISARDISSATPVNEEKQLVPLLTYKGFLFRDDGESEVSELATSDFSDDSLTGTSFEKALILQQKNMVAYRKQETLELLRDSMKERVLMQNTAFIVLETEEQDQELIEKNQKLLDGIDASVDASDPAAMDEPSMLISLLLFIPLITFLSLRKKIMKRKRKEASCT